MAFYWPMKNFSTGTDADSCARLVLLRKYPGRLLLQVFRQTLTKISQPVGAR